MDAYSIQWLITCRLWYNHIYIYIYVYAYIIVNGLINVYKFFLTIPYSIYYWFISFYTPKLHYNWFCGWKIPGHLLSFTLIPSAIASWQMVVNTVCLLAILYRHNGKVMNIDIIDYCQIQGCPTSAQTHTCPVSCGLPICWASRYDQKRGSPFPEMGNQFSEKCATGPGIPGLVNIQKTMEHHHS